MFSDKIFEIFVFLVSLVISGMGYFMRRQASRIDDIDARLRDGVSREELNNAVGSLRESIDGQTAQMREDSREHREQIQNLYKVLVERKEN